MSGAKVAFKASGLSELIFPPRKEAAMLANPPPDLPLPISGESVILTVYFGGILKAITILAVILIAATLQSFLRMANN